MNALIRILTEADAPWGPGWQPDAAIMAWFKNLLSHLNDGAVWAMPGTGQFYRISHANKTMTLIMGSPNDPQHWHDKNKVTMAKLGYKVLDGPPNPEEQAFAESARRTASVMLEDGVSFDKQGATLEYRPYQTQDGWKWFWVLLPDDKSRALASGTGDSRAAASTMARLKARKLGIVIQNVDLMTPYTP